MLHILNYFMNGFMDSHTTAIPGRESSITGVGFMYFLKDKPHY